MAITVKVLMTSVHRLSWNDFIGESEYQIS